MVAENHKELLGQILDLLDTACQASLELLGRYSEGDADAAQTLLNDLRGVVQAVDSAQEPLLPQLEHAYTREMLENVADTLDDVERSMQAGDTDRAAMKLEFQLFPFLRQLKEGFYFWGAVYPDKDAMARYYQGEFAAHFRNFYVAEGEHSPVCLSIVVTAYNHLDTTKRCMEQLLKETDFEKLNAELILIDHGSTDGTLEYFEGLGIGKVIHFKHNARMYMFSMLAQACQGEYFAFVSNDILVTRNWADILLNCMRSDPKIIAAVPETPNIANLQMLDCPTNDPQAFIRWANERNQSDPSKWSDQARLMPPLGMYRTGAVSKIGFADPYFYSMEFWDDDFSFRARRAGYRQIVCGDVACYHFGSVTGKEAQKKENTLVYGRKLFEQKNGVDAWGNGFCYDYPTVQLFKRVFAKQVQYKLLGLNCGLGDTPLQIKNELRSLGQECELYQLTSRQAYLADLAPHAAQALWTPDLINGLTESLGERQFNLVYLGEDIGQYEDFTALLEAVSHRMAPGGCFIFTCENPFYAPVLYSLLQFSLPEGKKRFVMADPAQLQKEAEKYFFSVQMISMEKPVEGTKDFAKFHFGRTSQFPQIVNRLEISKYYFACIK